MATDNHLPPKENALFKRILVSIINEVPVVLKIVLTKSKQSK